MKQLTNKTIIVTGSEGFIGKHLVRKLESLNNTVIRIDRQLGSEVINIKSLNNVDLIYHLAAQSSVRSTDERSLIIDNVNAFNYLCELTAKYNVKLVYASSANAYQKNYQSIYGITKYLNEIYASTFDNIIGARFYNVYGSGARPDTLIGKLLNCSRITLVNQGRSKRYFTYIDNIIEGLMQLAFSDCKLSSICNPEINSINDVVDEVKKYKELKVYYDPDDLNQEDTQYLDDSIPNLDLQYIDIRTGIKNILNYENDIRTSTVDTTDAN